MKVETCCMHISVKDTFYTSTKDTFNKGLVYLGTKNRLFLSKHTYQSFILAALYNVPEMLLTLVNVTKTADSHHINLRADRLEKLCDTISCYDFTHFIHSLSQQLLHISSNNE